MSRIPNLKPDRVIRTIKRARFKIREGTKHTIVIKDNQIITMIPRGSKIIKNRTIEWNNKRLGNDVGGV